MSYNLNELLGIRYFIDYEGVLYEDICFLTIKDAEAYLKSQGYFYSKVNYGGNDYFDSCNNKANIKCIELGYMKYKYKVYEGK